MSAERELTQALRESEEGRILREWWESLPLERRKELFFEALARAGLPSAVNHVRRTP